MISSGSEEGLLVGSYEDSNEPSCSPRYWLQLLLASQGSLCSMQLVHNVKMNLTFNN
jgi:hypothetical protein